MNNISISRFYSDRHEFEYWDWQYGICVDLPDDRFNDLIEDDRFYMIWLIQGYEVNTKQ